MRDQIIFQTSGIADRRQGVSRGSLANGLQSVLQNGLRRNELFVHYQPRIDRHSGHINGVEALVRWNHPHLGMIEPERFVPVAEETGMISELGQWVLFTALATHKSWTDAGLKPGIMSVNVSPRQLGDSGFADEVKQLLDTVQTAPDQLELEITESTRLDDMDQVTRTMKALRDVGVRFAMDDFGAGYASLDYVRRLPVEAVKIDQSFIRNIVGNRRDFLLVRGMIALAVDLGLKVVAEGIESMEQLDVLRPMECHEFQGFLFERPMAGEAVTNLLSSPRAYAV
jgi:EAL domain-containing protein (putative c-di-GMP-specific phosphodiesterase class I)